MLATASKEKVFQIVSRVFKVPFSNISEKTASDSIKNWDSLKHMNLILALEDEFNVQFDSATIPKLLRVEVILDELKKKGIA